MKVYIFSLAFSLKAKAMVKFTFELFIFRPPAAFCSAFQHHIDEDNAIDNTKDCEVETSGQFYKLLLCDVIVRLNSYDGRFCEHL